MKKTLLILFVLLGSVITATAGDVVTVSSTDIPKGAKGTFSIDLDNTTTTFIGYEMVLTLPQGVTFSGAKLGDRYVDHSCQANNPYESDAQKTKIVVSSASSALIAGTSGSLLTIEVEVDNNVSGGELIGASLTGIKFSTGTLSTLSDVNFSLNIIEGIVLDEDDIALPASQTGVAFTLERTIIGGVWNTICLPFELSQEKAKSLFGENICEFKKVSSNGNKITVEFEKLDDVFEANHPYIVKPATTIASIKFTAADEITIDPDEASAVVIKSSGNKFIGTLRAGTTIPADNIFLGTDNKFYYSDGKTNTIKGFRGYFYLKDFKSTDASRQLKLVVDGEETTAIEGLYINGEPATVEGVYNLKGQRVDTPTQKGVYIKDGKKVVIK